MDDDRTRIDDLEARLNDLEARNERLEERLEGRTEPGLSRRQAIAGLIGGTALGAGTGSVVAGQEWGNVLKDGRPDTSREVSAASVTAARLNGVRQPWPGDVQSAIDGVSSTGGGVVRLVATEVYDPASTWHLRPGVVLDYGGARVELSSDIDLVYIYPGSQVKNAWNDLTDLGEYTSTVYTYDTDLAGDYDMEAGRTGVINGETYGPSTTAGRLFRLVGGPDTEIVFTHSVQWANGFDTIVEIDAGQGTGEKGWVNGNVVEGIYSGFRRGIWTHGSGDVLTNLFRGQWQTSSGCEYIWQHDHGDRNVFWGIAWDTRHCEIASWEINDGEDNLFAAASVLYKIVDNTDRDNLVQELMEPFSIRSLIDGDTYYTDPPNRTKGPFVTGYYEEGIGDHRHEEVFPKRTDRLLPLRMAGAGIGWTPTNLTDETGPNYPVVRYHDGSGSRPAGPYLWEPAASRWVRLRIDESTTIR